MARGGAVVSGCSSQWRWTSVHDQYKTTEILGQGTYGVVYKAEHKATGELVAMKRCRLDAFREYGIPETTLREIALLRDLRHENIMTLFHVSCNTERLYLICEYLDLDLKKYIRSRPRGIPVRKVKEITYELFKGLAFCHGHRVIHRDLKPHNVLVSSDLSKVKIADFGLARSALAPGKTLTHEVITLWYRAPELLLGHCNYTSGVDIWSVGCIIAELLSLKPLYLGDSEIDTVFKIFRMLGTPKKEDWPEHAVVSWDDFPKITGTPDPFANLITGGLDDDGKDLLHRIFQYNPGARISALEALRHPWLAEVREATLAAGEEMMKPEWMEWEHLGEESTAPTTDGELPEEGGVSLIEELNEDHLKKIKEMLEENGDDLGRSIKEVEDSDLLHDNTGALNDRSDGENAQKESLQNKYHDVARMAQRMKELEEKLREVERQRIDPNNSDPKQPQQQAPFDHSTGVPTRTTTATSSPVKDQQQQQTGEVRRHPEEETIEDVGREEHAVLSPIRRNKFGTRKKTVEVDDALAKDKKDGTTRVPTYGRWGVRTTNATANEGGKLAQGNVQGTGVGGTAGKPKGSGIEFMGKWRRSSIGNLFERARRREPQQQQQQQQLQRHHHKEEVQHRGEEKEVVPNDVKKHYSRYERSQQQNLQHDLSIDSSQTESVFDERQSMKNVMPQQPLRHSFRNPYSGRIAASTRYSLPPPAQQQGGWRNWNGPPNQNAYDTTRLVQEHGEYDPYETQRYQQRKAQRFSNQHPYKQQGFHRGHHDQRNDYNKAGQDAGRMKIGKDGSVLRHSLPTSSDSYYMNCPPSSGTSARELTSSLGGVAPIPNSNASSFQDIALDVECSFNWTSTQNDTLRHRKAPTFQQSTYQGMMFSSDGSDRWKRSSSYGGSGAKESIARLNLKFAANASVIPNGSGDRVILPSVSHYVPVRHGSRLRSDFENYEPDSGHYFNEDATAFRSFVGREDELYCGSHASSRHLELNGHHFRDPYGIASSVRRHTIEVASKPAKEMSSVP